MNFEQGPIRPPSEAFSLLIRATRNCPWNKCDFCINYKGKKFSRRSVAEIKKDILTVKNMCQEIRQLSERWGEEGNITPGVVERLKESYGYQYMHVAFWLYHGGKTVFIQDANSLIMKTSDLLEVLQEIRQSFPRVQRITTYARAKTARRKSRAELEELRQAGLSRVHMGLESGSDDVLRLINKGAGSVDMIEGGRNLCQAGISLCYYVILGMGGQSHSREHVRGTVRVLNCVNPDHIRFRTLAVIPESPLAEKVKNGIFKPLPEDSIVQEQKCIIKGLEGIKSVLVSDHALNLLEEVQGKLPAEKEYMLGIIDRYLQMSEKERNNFRLGRRTGVYRLLDDMKDPEKYRYVEKGVRYLQNEGTLEETIDYLRQRFL